MKLDLFQIDAFTAELFRGNPACVVPLASWLPDEILLQIMKENGVAETAFFVQTSHEIHLRWFTPEIEMDLCGHATLAAAHALKTILNYPKDSIVFTTLCGQLTVKVNNGTYTLDLPARKPIPSKLPELIMQAINILPVDVLKSRDYVLIYETEQDVRNFVINRQIFDQINLDPGGLVITAKGNKFDFVSRYFTPQSTILEDPVTGSAHCSLIPYWSEKLNKKDLTALQASERTRILYCSDRGDRVFISGSARTYSIGTLWTS